jgi:flagellar basal body-associated protein FliL
MGTTSCIVLVDGNDAYIAHVGDSRIYLYEDQKKRLFRITKDHSFVQSLVDMGQLDDRDAEHHPRKNVIMKALGTREELKPEVYMSPVQPAKGDMFLICSDGLSGMVDDDGIEAILSSDQSIEQKVLDLVTNADVPGKGLDNITAQVIKVVESPYPLSNHPDHNPNWRKEAYSTPTHNVANNPTSQQAMPPKKKKTKVLLAILIPAVVLMLLIGGGVAAYFIWWHGKEKTECVQEQKEPENKVEQQDDLNKVEVEEPDLKAEAEAQAEEEVKTEAETKADAATEGNVKAEEETKVEAEAEPKSKSKPFDWIKKIQSSAEKQSDKEDTK